jgi:dTDP-4-dehydrorhamnose reductase
MQTWLVTGANGFLGSNAGRVLTPMYDTVGLVRSGNANSFSRTVKADLTHPSQVSAAITEIKPDVILHCAALADHLACEIDPELARSVNVEASRHLAKVASDLGIKFIHISTDAVFDGRRGNYAETDPVNPFTVYGESKAQAESEVIEINPEALVVRTNIFGWSPSGTRSILEYFVGALERPGKVAAYTDYIVSSLYAPELIEILTDEKVLKHRGVLNIAASNALSKFQFGTQVAHALGVEPHRLRPELRWAKERPGDDVNLGLDLRLLLEISNISTSTQGDGISRALREIPDANLRTKGAGLD